MFKFLTTTSLVVAGKKTNSFYSLIAYNKSFNRNIKTDINKVSRGDIIKDGPGKYLEVDSFVFSKRGRCNAVVTFETVDLWTGKKISKKYRGGDDVDLCEFDTKDVRYVSENNKGYVFEDIKDSTEYLVPKSLFTAEMLKVILGGYVKKIGMVIDEETSQGLKVIFPSSMVFTIEKTDGAVSGTPNDRHSPVTKAAVLDVGITIKVPGFLVTGDRVVVTTKDWNYRSRATEADEMVEEEEEEKNEEEENEEEERDEEEEEEKRR